MLAVLLERIVGAESVGNDDEISMVAGRERNAHRRRQATLRASPVEYLSDGTDVNGVALEYFDERVFEGVCTGGVEQLK
jgi:hypothetical protein